MLSAVTAVRFRATADTLASFVRCNPISRVNEEFRYCLLPFTVFGSHLHAVFLWVSALS